MNIHIRNIIAIIVGVFIGALVNMGIVSLGPYVIPPPEGVDLTHLDSLKENMLLLEPKNFIFPFLAHALGTLVGAFVAVKIAVKHHTLCALIVGITFLIGGTLMIRMVGGPVWYIATDLIFAYLPMAYLGRKLAKK
ncbi:MAG: hypothetical protein AB8B80_00910 [Marinicellaceae bacterium]